MSIVEKIAAVCIEIGLLIPCVFVCIYLWMDCGVFFGISAILILGGLNTFIICGIYDKWKWG